MCMACEEMQFYDLYLEAVADARRKEQPWECEVVLFKDGEAVMPTPAEAKATTQTSPFACDEAE